MKLIHLFLGCVFLISLVSAQEASMYIELSNNFVVLDVGLVEGRSKNFDFEDAEYSAIVNSLSGEETKVEFSFPKFAFIDEFDNPNAATTIVLEESSELLFFPYYGGVDKLNVYDKEEKLVLTYDLSEYRVCDYNGMCLGIENELNCPEDCSAKEKEFEDKEEFFEGIVAEKPGEEPKSNLLYVVLIIFAVIIMVAFFLFKRKKQKPF